MMERRRHADRIALVKQSVGVKNIATKFGFHMGLGFAFSLILLIGLMNPAGAQTVVAADSLQQRVKACVACHGQDGRATTDGFYPRIAGTPAGYLFNQLRHFREAKRVYPMMTYMVAHMNDAYLQEIADYFAALNPPYAAPQTSQATPVVMERGRSLVKMGDLGRKLPACVACHGDKMTGVAPFIPGLLGLPRDYLVAQLGAWKTGSRHAASPDCMQTVAQQLDANDIAAVSAWLAVQTMPADTKAATPTKDFNLPIACGSLKP
ncbi:c-type cytochrome [Undibacterium sp.]|uniref:c-type cytochrome n=1 Tax=Undibacterium sp. TaxID=1914977 RepID=UPI003752AC34